MTRRTFLQIMGYGLFVTTIAPLGIDLPPRLIGDGIADDTVALQAWLDNGGGVLPGGVYRVTDTIEIKRNKTMLIGKDMPTIASSNAGQPWLKIHPNTKGAFLSNFRMTGGGVQVG